MENHSTSDIDIETAESSKKGLTRRQVATGAAWAVPVVALAVAAPSASASTTDPDAWQNNLFSQFSLVSSTLNVGSYKVAGKNTIIRATAPTQLVIINNSSTHDVPVGAATITLTLTQTSGTTFATPGLVFQTVGVTAPTGLTTQTVSWTNDAVIPAGGRTPAIPIGYHIPLGTTGVGASTGWNVTVTTITGQGVYNAGLLGAWTGATVL